MKSRFRIVFVGLSGSGKTKFGRSFSAVVGVPFYDTDLVFEEENGLSVADAFSLCGESFFRDKEELILSEVLSRDSFVLSTGGGVVEREKNVLLLEKEPKVVFLDAKTEILCNRIETDCVRPLLKGDCFLKLKALRERRAALYKKVSKLFIDTGELSEEEVIKKLVSFSIE